MDTWETIPKSWLDELRLAEGKKPPAKRPVQFSLRAVLITTAALAICFATVAPVLRETTAESAGRWIYYQVETVNDGVTVELLARLVLVTFSMSLGMGMVLVPLVVFCAWGRCRGGRLLLRVLPRRTAWQFVVMLCFSISVATRALMMLRIGSVVEWDYISLGVMSGLFAFGFVQQWPAMIEICEHGVITCGGAFRSWQSIRRNASVMFWRSNFYVGSKRTRRKIDVPIEQWKEVQNLLRQHAGDIAVPDATENALQQMANLCAGSR